MKPHTHTHSHVILILLTAFQTHLTAVAELDHF